MMRMIFTNFQANNVVNLFEEVKRIKDHNNRFNVQRRELPDCGDLVPWPFTYDMRKNWGN